MSHQDFSTANTFIHTQVQSPYNWDAGTLPVLPDLLTANLVRSHTQKHSSLPKQCGDGYCMYTFKTVQVLLSGNRCSADFARYSINDVLIRVAMPDACRDARYWPSPSRPHSIVCGRCPAKRRGQRFDLERIADGRTGGMAFEIADAVRTDAGELQGIGRRARLLTQCSAP